MTTSDLRGLFGERVVLPRDREYDTARRPWNLAVEQDAAAIVRARDVSDISALIRHARRAGLGVAVQPRGHGASGAADGTILLRTAGLDEVRIDAHRRTARIGAGVSWERAQAAAAAHGLTGLPGSSPVVTVAGYTLGGGLSWFSRKHGHAARHVTAVEVVDAAGRPSRVTAESDPDLFWALRGGGGDLAVVSALEFVLHPAPRMYGGRVSWPDRYAAEVFAAFQEIVAAAPDELTAWYERIRIPGRPPVVAVDVTYLGGAAAAAGLLRPLDRVGGSLTDTRAAMPVTALGDITAEPTAPGPGLSRAELLNGIGGAGTLVGQSIEPLLSLQIRHLGGALRHAAAGAAGRLPEPYLLYLFGVPRDAATAAAIRNRQSALVDSLGHRVVGRKPFTFLSPGEQAADAFHPPTLHRLRELKRARDPRNTFRSNYPVLADADRTHRRELQWNP